MKTKFEDKFHSSFVLYDEDNDRIAKFTNGAVIIYDDTSEALEYCCENQKVTNCLELPQFWKDFIERQYEILNDNKETMSKLREQLGLMHDIRVKANINIVTCGHCGTILLHKMDDETITCWECNSEMEMCDCPDCYYEGMPELDDQ